MARRFLIPLLCLLALPAAAEPIRAESVKRQCFSAAETREEIAAHHLMEPFAILKSAASAAKAEAISAKLCRWGEEYVYEISLLHHDGRLVRQFMNAINGKPLGSRNFREPAPRI
jgi:hypothetical protein